MSNKTKKLSGKILASYALYQFAFDSMWMLNNYFLLFFYTDVIKIPAAAATVIFMIARVWDTINDPMMGVIVDKTRSKEGKSRFWLSAFLSHAVYLCRFVISVRVGQHQDVSFGPA